MFSYWPCYRSEGSCIGLMTAVLDRVEAEGKYSHPKANTTDRGSLIGMNSRNKYVIHLVSTYLKPG